MLKKFFVSMLGTMAGLWLSLLILGIVSVMGVVILAGKASSAKSVSNNSILYVDLAGVIDERQSQASLSDIMSYVNEKGDDLATILSAIRLSADDKRIKGIFINCAGAELGVASRGEIIDAINEFKKSDKWVYAYADNFTQGDYYIATAADSLYINPVGSLTVKGLAANIMFFKDLADKLGIGIDVVRVGSFKSAVEPFMRMDMSPESRMQTEVYLNGIWGEMKSTIAANRGIADTKTIDCWADSLAFTWAPERYVEQKAVSALRYRSDVDYMLRALVDIDDDKDLPFVTPADYMVSKQSDLINSMKAHIAVLYAVGDITEDDESGIASQAIVPEIERLGKDENVKGLILRVNSPGGSAYASEQIWKALEDFKATGKPYYVSMSDYAASGGYYISCGADCIYCDPTTITGSIGIFGIIPNGNNLIEKKIGIGLAKVETNPNATFPNIYYKPTQYQLDCMQQYVNRGYETFTSRVAQGRGIPVDSVKAIGGGRVWDGLSAKRLGLVDELGGLYTAIKAMAQKTGLDEKDVVAYPEIKANVFETLIKESQKNIEVNIEGVSAEDVMLYYNYINRLTNAYPLQARMPMVNIRF